MMTVSQRPRPPNTMPRNTMYIYIYIYIYVYMRHRCTRCTYIYIYIYEAGEDLRHRRGGLERA